MRKIILVILVLNLTSCKGQIKKNANSSIKKDTMEYFDIKKFKEGNLNRNHKEIFLEDGTIINQYEHNDYYQEIITNKKNAYSIFKGFSRKDGLYIGGGSKFYGFDIGVYEMFDENGNIIKEINHDLEFKISVKDLAKIMREKYGCQQNS
jgi:hypothetical protein